MVNDKRTNLIGSFGSANVRTCVMREQTSLVLASQSSTFKLPNYKYAPCMKIDHCLYVNESINEIS